MSVRVYLTDEPWPTSAEIQAIADAASGEAASMVAHTANGQIPVWLQALGVTVTGYHDIPDDLDALKAEALSRLSDRRMLAERTFTFDGFSILLDQPTQARISAAIQGLQFLPAGTTIKWQVAPGQFVTFDLARLQALGVAAFVHIQGCFTNVQALADSINAAADAQALSIVSLEVGWPA